MLPQALRAHRKGDLVAATTAYLNVIEGDRNHLDAWMNLAAVYVLRGAVAQARRAYAEARMLGERDPRVLRDVGIGLASIGASGDAREALRACLALDESTLGPRIVLSRVCGEDGDRSEAIEHALHATRRGPDDASAWLELARAHFDDHHLADTIAAAERAVALDPRHVTARITLAGSLAWNGDALRAWQLCASQVPDEVFDALRSVMSWRCTGTRAFAYKRDAIVHALAAATLAGDVVEFGVRYGVSTRILASQVEGVVHGFDSFRGLPEAWGSLPEGAFSMEGVAPPLPGNVVLHEGLFEDTAPRYVAGSQTAMRLVHIDSDLYASARTALFAVAPRVGSGSVLLFDEYTSNVHWRDDEYRAFHEASAHFGWTHDAISLSWITGQAAFRVG
jgi:Flp pilus assembly protein TadD